MAENLFKDSQCPIDATPKVDFNFISSVCDIAPLPPPIYGCQAPIIPREPPTDVGTQCPNFSTLTSIDVNFVDETNNGCRPSKNELRITRRDVDPCQYDVTLDIDVGVPRIPCPTLTPGTFGLDVGYQDCITPLSEIRITPIITPGDCNTPNQCEFVLDLDLRIPIPKTQCPQIVVTDFGVYSGYADSPCMLDRQNKFFIKPVITTGDCDTPDECRFEVELEISVPIPRPPCPTINLTKFSVDSGFSDSSCLDDKQNFFSITPRHTPGDCNTPDRCDFDIELEILVPIPRTPCPALNPPTIMVSCGFSDSNCLTGSNRFEITTNHTPGDCNTPDQCEFNFDLEIVVPIPRMQCPIINEPTLSVNTLFNDQNCTLNPSRFSIIPKHTPGDCNTADRCEFNVELEINVPIPRTPCPVINAPTFEVKTGFSDSLCAQGDSIFTITPSHTPGDCATPDQCSFDVDLAIVVPIPRTPCPILNTTKFEVTAGFSDSLCAQQESSFTITPRPTPGSCDDPGQCEFDFDLTVVVPIPRTPCPVINTTKFEVNVKYDDPTCVVGSGSTFEIKPRQIPGDCTTPDQCEFDVELTIDVPIPKPPCPNINVNTFEVTTGLSDSPCVQNKTNRFEIKPRITPGDCNAPDQCDFDIDLEIVVPIPPPPCIDITKKFFNVKTGFVGTSCVTGQSRFEIIKTVTPASGCDQPERCDFEIEIEIVVPIPRPRCPRIGRFLTVNSHYSDGPGGRRSNTPSFFNLISIATPPTCKDPGSCNFLFDIHIDVPTPRPPCTQFRLKNVQSDVGYDVPQSIRFDIKRCDEYDEKIGTNDPPVCCFELDVELYIQIPKPPCTAVALAVDMEVLPPQAEPYAYATNPIFNFNEGYFCNVLLPLAIGIPRQCDFTIQGGEGIAYAGCGIEPRAEILVDKIDSCSFKLTPYIWIPKCPPPPCPEIEVHVDVKKADAPYGYGRVTKSQVGTGDEIQCLYDIYIDIGVPGCTPKLIGKHGTIYPIGCAETPTAEIMVEQTGACEWTISPYIRYSDCTITKGKVNITPSGVGSGTVTVEGDEITIDINLNTVACPSSSGGGSGGGSGESGSGGSTMPMMANPLFETNTTSENNNESDIITFTPSPYDSDNIAIRALDASEAITVNAAELVRSPAFLNAFIEQLGSNTTLQNALRAVLNT